MTIQEHVGARIHLYRKRQHLTLEQLAHLIHKTPSTVSKYEQGKIAVDVTTLQEISEALSVSLAQLVDYHIEKSTSSSGKTERGFFSLQNRYYMYQYFIPKKEPILCVIEIIPDPTSTDDRVMLYYDADNTEDYTSANFIYQGSITYYDSFVTIKVQNVFGMKDEVYVLVKNPFWVRNVATGLMLCLSQSLGNPVATKVLFSAKEITDHELLRYNLDMNNKEVLGAMKRNNYLALIDSWDKML